MCGRWANSCPPTGWMTTQRPRDRQGPARDLAPHRVQAFSLAFHHLLTQHTYSKHLRAQVLFQGRQTRRMCVVLTHFCG